MKWWQRLIGNKNIMTPPLKSRLKPGLKSGGAPKALRQINEKQVAQVRYLLDKLPMPAWIRRSNDLFLIYCNTAYADALDVSPQEAVEHDLPLAATVLGEDGKSLARAALELDAPQSASHNVVINGQRRFLEFNELPMVDGSAVIGYASDFTSLERAQAELDRHIAAHQDVLEYMDSAIVVFGPDRRLLFHNAAYANLWRLEEEYLAAAPTFEDVMEELRARRRIPEVADFSTYKRQQVELFKRLLEPKQELLHLPDERTLKLMTIPHPMGGLMFLYENVTDRLALERNCQTLQQVQQAAFDSMPMPMLIIGGDGRLRYANPAANAWSELPLDQYAGQEIIIGEILAKLQSKLTHGTIPWERYVTFVAQQLQRRKPYRGKFNDTHRYQLTPLPDGGVLLVLLPGKA